MKRTSVVLAVGGLVLASGCNGDKPSLAADGGLDDGGLPMVTGSGDEHAIIEDTLVAAKTVTNLFVEEDPTLDLDGTAGDNGDAIAARLAEATSGCAAVTLQHDAGSATVTADFDECTFTLDGVEIAVDGHVSASASVMTAGGTTTVAVTLLLGDTEPFTVNGIAMSGTLGMSTSDLTAYTLSIDDLVVLVGGVQYGPIDFAGTADVTADPWAVTLNGTGTYTGASLGGDVKYGGTTCTSTQSVFAVVGLHRQLAECYADSGSMTSTREYTCNTMRATVLMTVAVTGTWDDDTASSGEIDVSVTTTVNDRSTTAGPTTVALPTRDCTGA